MAYETWLRVYADRAASGEDQKSLLGAAGEIEFLRSKLSTISGLACRHAVAFVVPDCPCCIAEIALNSIPALNLHDRAGEK